MPTVNPAAASKYERIKLLGKGTFGKAWRVRAKTDGAEYVAKEIKVENKQDLEDALAEADVLSKLDHPNIVKYHEVIRNSPKLVTIVMEFCDDGELGEKIARRKFRSSYFEEDLILFWFVQLTQALSYLHGKGILHRDVKTANLFLTKQGNVKLGDFGIARIMDRNSEVASQRTAKTPVGTPMYMAPEICANHRYDQKADIWAAGCVLYEMTSLRPAFMAYSMESLMAKIKRGHHDKHLPRHFSSRVRDLVAAILLVDPKKRPTADQLLQTPFLASIVAKADAVSGMKSFHPDAARAASSDKPQQGAEVLVISAPSDKRPSANSVSPAMKRASAPSSGRAVRFRSPRPSDNLGVGGALRGYGVGQQNGKSPLGVSPAGTPVMQRRAGDAMGQNWYSNQHTRHGGGGGGGGGYRGRWR